MHTKDYINHPNAPATCHVHFTNRCFMRCKMCNFWRRKEPHSNIPLFQWEKFFLSLRKFLEKPISVSIGGREALTQRDIFPFIKMLSGIGFRTLLTSNGYLIDENMAIKIVESNLMDISLSLDSLDSYTHDYLRGRRGTFERFMNAIKHLRKISDKLVIVICTTIMEKNINCIMPLAQWVEDNNDLNNILFQAVMQPFDDPREKDWYEKEKYTEIWPRDTELVCAVLGSLIRLKQEMKLFKTINTPGQFEIYKRYFRNPKIFVERKSICNSIDHGIFIYPDGKLSLCTFMPPIGDIYRDFEDVYYSPEAQIRRQEIAACKKVCHFLLNCYYEDQVIL